MRDREFSNYDCSDEVCGSLNSSTGQLASYILTKEAEDVHAWRSK